MDEDWERNAKLAQAGYADALEQVMDTDDVDAYTIPQEAKVPLTQFVTRNQSGEHNHVSYVDSDDDMDAHALRKEAISLVFGEEADEECAEFGDIMPLPSATEDGEEKKPAAAAAPPRKAKKPAMLAPGAYSVVGSLAVARHESGALTPMDRPVSQRLKQDEQDCVEQQPPRNTDNDLEQARESNIGAQDEPKNKDGEKNPIAKKHYILPALLVIVVVVALAVGLGVSLPKNSSAAAATPPPLDPAEATYDFNAILAACESSGSIGADLIPNSAKTKAVDLTLESNDLIHVDDVLSCRPENLALWWLVGDDATYAPANKLERFALATLYFALGGSVWRRNYGWLSTTTTTCEWEGVTCDRDALVVIDLDLLANNLEGNLPTRLGHLTNLERLVLGANGIGGPLPTELGLLTSLQYLQLKSNIFAGELPSEIGLLTELVALSAADNHFVGQLRSEFGTLTRLEEFDISSNSLDGTIPSELFLLTMLKNLGLSNNFFRSTLATEIGLLSDLAFFECFDTIVSGTIPTQMGMCTALTRVELHRNDLSGSLPTELANIVLLETLFLQENRLVGTVSDAICALPALNQLTTSFECNTGAAQRADQTNVLVCPDGCCTSTDTNC
jgi:Leucine-rich repeat (LRR) protein